MAKTNVLDRVSADLAFGRTQPAIQRLSSLVAVHPTDLDLRRRLAAVHRMVGNRIEAGRWDYLTPGADTAEAAAFERAFPSPARRLAALRWPHRAGLAATEYARARLDTLARAAAFEPRRQPHDGTHNGPRQGRPRRRQKRQAVGLAVAGLAAAFFVVLGTVTVAQWLLT